MKFTQDATPLSLGHVFMTKMAIYYPLSQRGGTHFCYKGGTARSLSAEYFQHFGAQQEVSRSRSWQAQGPSLTPSPGPDGGFFTAARTWSPPSRHLDVSRSLK